jgi:hypothetical protein
MVFRKFVSSVLLLAWLLPCAALAQVNVAAASDLKFALPEVATAFERRGGEKLQISFGSSGNFRRQIAEGAPFELFFSADEAYADALIAEGRAQAPGLLYGIANGLDWSSTGRLAAVMGAIKIAHRGGQNHVPSREEIASRHARAFGSRPW